jgi:hypothetical protein
MAVNMIFRIAAATLLLGAAALAPVAADDTGMASSHDWRREGGRTCFLDHYHSGSGSGATKAAAQKDAISSWAGFTDFEYGSDWAHFSRAASKSMSCSKGANGFDCQLSARPCR